MYEYTICSCADEEIFYRQCKALEKHIQGLIKGRKLTDVDGSLIQVYYLNGKDIVVHNSRYIDSVYISSEVDLEPYFCK